MRRLDAAAPFQEPRGLGRDPLADRGHAEQLIGGDFEGAREISVTRGSGNVFADLGLPNPEERLAKAQLAYAISRVIKERGLTQRAAAVLMGIDQPKVSHVLRGRLADFSTDRLMGFLTGLGRDIEIVVKMPPKSRKKGRILVAAA